MRQEIVSNKEAHEDPVVHTPLELKGERQASHGQFPLQVLESDDRTLGPNRQNEGQLPQQGWENKKDLQVKKKETHLTQDCQSNEDEVLLRTW